MEQKLNKKLLLIGLKHFPWIIAMLHLLGCVLSCFGIQTFILAELCSVSLLPSILLLLFSKSLGYCIWHRLPIYYVMTNEVISIFDYYVGVPVSDKWMLMIYLIIAGLFVLLGAWLKNRYNVNKRNIESNAA